MLSDRDIDKLMKAFATKQELNEVREQVTANGKIIRKILSIVEGFASTKDKKNLEDAVRDTQLSRHDGWIKQIAQETSVKLKG